MRIADFTTRVIVAVTTRSYWIGYYLLYPVLVAIFSIYNHRELLAGSDRLQTLAVVMGVSAGLASLLAVIIELGGRALLLIPKAVNALLDKGREEAKQEQRQRMERILEVCGSQKDGATVLTITPEVLAYLAGQTDDLPYPTEGN